MTSHDVIALVIEILKQVEALEFKKLNQGDKAAMIKTAIRFKNKRRIHAALAPRLCVAYLECAIDKLAESVDASIQTLLTMRARKAFAALSPGDQVAAVEISKRLGDRPDIKSWLTLQLASIALEPKAEVVNAEDE